MRMGLRASTHGTGGLSGRRRSARSVERLLCWVGYIGVPSMDDSTAAGALRHVECGRWDHVYGALAVDGWRALSGTLVGGRLPSGVPKEQPGPLNAEAWGQTGGWSCVGGVPSGRPYASLEARRYRNWPIQYKKPANGCSTEINTHTWHTDKKSPKLPFTYDELAHENGYRTTKLPSYFDYYKRKRTINKRSPTLKIYHVTTFT